MTPRCSDATPRGMCRGNYTSRRLMSASLPLCPGTPVCEKLKWELASVRLSPRRRRTSFCRWTAYHPAPPAGANCPGDRPARSPHPRRLPGAGGAFLERTHSSHCLSRCQFRMGARISTGAHLFVQGHCPVFAADRLSGRCSGSRRRGHPYPRRLLQRLGFTILPYHGSTGSFGEFWENFYTWLLIWTYNPASLRSHPLLGLQRNELWTTKARFLQRFGTG